MPITVVGVAQGSNNIVTDVASPTRLRALVRALQHARVPGHYTVDVNEATGTCGSGASVTDVVRYLRSGHSFADYGAWPWGSCPVTPYSLGGGGFGQFLYQAGVDLGSANGPSGGPSYNQYTGSGNIRALGVSTAAGVVAGASAVGVVAGGAAAAAAGAAAAGSEAAAATATAVLGWTGIITKAAVPVALSGWSGLLGGAGLSVASTSGIMARAAQHDPYSFAKVNWNFQHSLGYPYGFGLVTTTNLAAHPDRFRVGPGPVGHSTFQSHTGGAVNVYMYASFAIKVVGGWYFFAVPQVSPAAYARFIVDTLTGGASGSVRVAGNTAGTATAKRAVATKALAPTRAAGPCIDTILRDGSTGTDVRTLQRALLHAGFGVGPTGADGKFGADTAQAVRLFQSSRKGQRNACGTMTVDGVVGPVTWRALGVDKVAATQVAVGGGSVNTGTAGRGSGTGAGGTSAAGRRATAMAHKVSPKGVWKNGHGYAVVNGKDVLEKTAPAAGGIVVVDGFKVHFPKQGSPGIIGGLGGTFNTILGEESKMLHVSTKVAEIIDLAAIGGIAVLLATQGNGK